MHFHWEDSNHVQYPVEELLQHDGRQYDSDDGVGEVGLLVVPHQEDDDEASHCQQHSCRLVGWGGGVVCEGSGGEGVMCGGEGRGVGGGSRVCV